MASNRKKKRLSRIEAASLPKAWGIIWVYKGEDFVNVGDVKMSVDEFHSRYPGGIIVRVVREASKPIDPNA